MNKKLLLLGLVLLCFISIVNADTEPLNATGGLNYSINSVNYYDTIEYFRNSVSWYYLDNPSISLFNGNSSYINNIVYEYKGPAAQTSYTRVKIVYDDATTYTTPETAVYGQTVYTEVTKTNPYPTKKIDTIGIEARTSGGSAIYVTDIDFTKNSYVDGIDFTSSFNFKTINITSDGCNINVSRDATNYHELVNDTYTFGGFTDTVYVMLDNSSNCSYINIQAQDFATYYKVLNLIDEVTNEAFNITSTNSTKATLICTNIGSFSYDINSNNQNLSLTCPYDKITVSVTYDDTSYSRTILEDFGESDLPVYLIDLTTTQAIYNAFLVNDYVGEYTNPSIYIKKNIGGEEVSIHSDYLDVENKVSVYLIENDAYTLELHSDNNPVNVLGFYGADITGTKEITVTTTNTNTDAPEVIGNGVSIYTYSYNDTTYTGQTFAYALFNDTSESTTSVTWSLFLLNESDNTLTDLYNVTTTGTYGVVDFVPYNITNMTNNTLISAVSYVQDGEQRVYYRQISSVSSDIRDNSMFSYFTESGLQWGIMIFLSLIALSGTITTQNYVNYVVIGAAGLFVVFKILTVSIVLLALALVINLMFQMKSSDQTRIPR